MKRLSLILLGAFAMASATWLAGWWGVGIVALAWGWRGRARDAAVAALLAWGALLAWQAAAAPLVPFATRLGGIFSLPGWAILVLTPLFAALLAWAAAALLDSRKKEVG